MNEFEKLSNGESEMKTSGSKSRLAFLKANDENSRSRLFLLGGLKKRSLINNFSTDKLSSISYLDCNLNENQLLNEKNQSLLRELNHAKVGYLSKSRLIK